MESENPLLDRYVLAQSDKSNPKVCFVPTASGDSDSYTTRFYDFFEKENCQPSHFSLFKPPTRDLEGFLLEKDIIYVGGGNTKNLLVLWKEWGLIPIFKKALEQGIILAGISAGSICWFEKGVTDSYGDGLETLECLGFLKGSNCPHYDGEAERRPAFHRFIESGEVGEGIAADDGAAVHYIDGSIHKIVSSRPDAKAYRVYFDGKVIEEELETEFLGERNN